MKNYYILSTKKFHYKYNLIMKKVVIRYTLAPPKSM